MSSIERLSLSTTQAGVTTGVILSGTQIGAGAITMVSGATISDHNLIVNGAAVDLSPVTFTNWTNGLDTITINGTGGIDTLTGSGQDDAFRGFAGGDMQTGGAGDDTFFIVGMEGLGDTFAGGADADNVQVLGAGAATLAGFNATISLIEAWQGNGQGLFGTAAANVFNFAALTSKTGLPFVDGRGGNDAITGSIFADNLRGNAGNDILKGGLGIDMLTGGLGKDILAGGANRDFFDFNSFKESVKGGSRDVITDFVRAVDDRIDVRGIDAKTGVGGNQKFKFIGQQAFHDVKGELRCKNGIVQGDVNGDGVADFEIKVNLATLVSGDFFL
jgi:serralysin